MQRPYGSFCWYELMTSDLAAAQKFYGEVIGWTARTVDQPKGPYGLFVVDESMVAGALPMPDAPREGGMTPLWMGYIDVPDVDAHAAKVTAAGGTIHRQPEDIPGVGRFAVAADPGGAVFVLFTPAPGSTPLTGDGEPGHAAWRELMAGDLENAWAFYSNLFGWTVVQEFPMGPMGVYRLFSTNGEGAAGGMMTKPPQVERPHWRYCFQVESVAAAVPKIASAGGALVNPPHEVPSGQWLIQATDPQGAFFALLSNDQ
jgi:uncharacterized protein